MNVKFNEIKGLQTRWGAYDARLACRERQEKVIVRLLVLMRFALRLIKNKALQKQNGAYNSPPATNQDR